MPITFDKAKEQTNPALDDTDESKDGNGLTERDRSALAIVQGVAANDAYWNSRSRIEQLEAQAAGHGVVQLPQEDPPPAAVAAPDAPPAVDSTAVDEPSPAVDPPKPTPDNPTEAVAVLRKQLEDAGINPEV